MNVAQNVGSTDRFARIALGALAGVVSLGALFDAVPLPSVASPVLGVLAVILLGTGLTGTCGFYSLIGVSTDRS
jgi:hypothetical protein